MFKTNFIIKQLLVYKTQLHTTRRSIWDLPKTVEFDKALFNPENLSEIEGNIKRRKSVGNIKRVQELYQQLNSTNHSNSLYESISKELHRECLLIPNKTHPEVCNYQNDPKLVKYVGTKRTFDFDHKEFHEITKRLNLVRTEQLGNFSGSRSYYLLGEMAQLEQALVYYFVDNLIKDKFNLISVPDILPRQLVECCGMNTKGERTQVGNQKQVKFFPIIIIVIN